MTDKNEKVQEESVKQLTEDDFLSGLTEEEQRAVDDMDKLSQILPDNLMSDFSDDEDDDDEEEDDPEDEDEDEEEYDDSDDEEELDDESLGDDEEDEEEYDDDLKSYSPDIRKLVMVERQKSLGAIEAEKNKRVAPKIDDSKNKDELSQTKLSALSSMEELAKIKMEESKRKRIKAVEEGDTEAGIDAEDEYHKNRDLYNKISSSKESLEKEIKEYKDAPAPDSTSKKTDDGVTNEGGKWLTKNAVLFQQRPEIYQAALLLDGKFGGGDPNSPAYFDMFNKILSVRFPDAKLQGTKKNTKKNTKKKASIVAGARGAPLGSKKKKSFRADNESRKMLEALGLDTSDPEVMKIAEQERKKLYKK